MALTPRQVELAEAALRLLARDGMAAVSFRSVAAESGWSLGAVQKAFRTKDSLLAAMFDRLRTRAGAPPGPEPGRPTLHAWLVELFLQVQPLTPETRAATIQGAAFSERAPFDADVAKAIAASDRELRRLLANLVRRALAEGEVRDVEPDEVAWAFLALAEGAAVQLLVEPQDPASVRALASGAIAGLLGLPGPTVPR